MPIDLDSLKAELSGRYQVEGELGSGRMAVVYLGTDLRHDRRVAIKVLRPDVAVSLGAKRFLREIDIAAHLTHPHILSLHDSGEAAGYLYYVMPFIDGESLRERLERETVLPVEEACRIAAEVGDALDYAHRQGVVHRDIKPENILLSDGHAFVMDFGLARALEESGGERLTQTGILVGSPIYGSPEQAGAAGPLDGRSDEYSLATVLYEMLTGEPPFSAASTRALLARKQTDAPSSPRLLRESIPPGVEGALLKALAKLPADRYQSVGAFRDELVDGQSSEAPADSHSASLWSELNRRHVFHTAVVYVVVALGVIQAADAMFPHMSIPEVAVRYLIAVAIVGFPIAVVLAWAYEINWDDIRRS